MRKIPKATFKRRLSAALSALFLWGLFGAAPASAEDAQQGFFFSRQAPAPAIPGKAWSLLVIPAEGRRDEQAWEQALERLPALRFAVALSPEELRELSPLQTRLAALRRQKRLEAALRLTGDPILPILYDLDSLKLFLPAGLALPAAKIGWPADAVGRIARGRIYYKAFFGDFPQGFVAGGGSLSLPVAEFLKDQNFSWTLAGFPTSEWPAGDSLLLEASPEKSLMVLAAHPAADALMGGPESAPLSSIPSPGGAPGARVRELMAQLQQAADGRTVPCVVFDEARSPLPLGPVLEECARQSRAAGLAMVLPSEAAQNAKAHASTSLQVWPHSWNWLKGRGLPAGPGLTAWVGDRAKNAAWDKLARAHDAVERYKNSGRARLEKLDRLQDALYAAQAGSYFEESGSAETTILTNAPAASAPGMEAPGFAAALAAVYEQLRLSSRGRDAAFEEFAPPPAATELAGGPGPEPVRTPDGPQLRREGGDGLAWTQPDEPLVVDASGKAQGNLIKKFTLRAPADQALVSYTFGLDPNGAEETALDLYIDINHRDGAGQTSLLPGRGGFVADTDAWEYALMARRQPDGKTWDCKLLRAHQAVPIYQAAARAAADGSLEVRIPRNLLGRDPLRWGYLVCIIGNDGSVADFMGPPESKRDLLSRLKASRPDPHSGSTEPARPSDAGAPAQLPMLRAEWN